MSLQISFFIIERIIEMRISLAMYTYLAFFRVKVNEDLKIQNIEIFYDPETFIKVVLDFILS